VTTKDQRPQSKHQYKEEHPRIRHEADVPMLRELPKARFERDENHDRKPDKPHSQNTPHAHDVPKGHASAAHPQGKPHGAPKGKRRVSRGRKRASLILIGIGVVVVAAGVVAIWASGVLLPDVTLTINNTQQTYAGNTTYASLQSTYGSLKAGDLYAVDGSFLAAGQGNAGSVVVNGKEQSDLNARLQNGEDVVWTPGSDATETYTEQVTQLPFGVEIDGNTDGALAVRELGQYGKDGTMTGDVSGITVHEHVDPVPTHIVYYNPAPQSKVIALTFDDGPGPYTERVIQMLQKYNVTATFFTVGEMLPQFPDAAKMERDGGFQQCTHTWDHKDLTKLSDADMQNEWQEAIDELQKDLGVTTDFGRAPYGSYTSKEWGRDNNIIGTLVRWNIDTDDWESSATPQGVANTVVSQAYPGAIVLMHDAGGTRTTTIAALDILIPQLQQEGYTFVTVQQLEQMCPPPDMTGSASDDSSDSSDDSAAASTTDGSGDDSGATDTGDTSAQ
jgi:peptidoglycan/xylan/chitin deacetylase (PgdA/CDA1 family)